MALLLLRVAPSFCLCGMEGASVMDATRNHLTDMSIDVILKYISCISDECTHSYIDALVSVLAASLESPWLRDFIRLKSMPH